MIEHKKTLHFLTTFYPFGKGESFVHNELLSLSQKFDKIYLYPIKLDIDSEIFQEKREIPKNVELIFVSQSYNFKSIIKKNIQLFIDLYFYDLNNDKISKTAKIKHFKKCMAYFAMAKHISDIVKSNIQPKENNTFYSFWMNEAALALSILKKTKQIPAFSFKCHGFDVYNEVHKEGFIPFRLVNYNLANHIITISQKNADYLKELYPAFKKKLKVIYLGTQNNLKPRIVDNKNYTIVSCSFMHQFKRVHKIPEILSNITDIHIDWYHFGGGDTWNHVIQESERLPENITFHPLGNMTHHEVLQFYKQHEVHLFMHLSTNEGLPVSMMEAISFGIPIIACDVGGVKEIVNDKTGILIPKKYQTEIVSKKIKDFITSKENYSKDTTFERWKYWEDNFNHSRNFNKLISFIKS